MWFVSTIIQFYLLWPLFVMTIKRRCPLLIGLIISLVWATFVGVIGKEEERVWNSFFLQYVWEFILGMWLANFYFNHPGQNMVPQWRYLLFGIFVGMGLSGLMAWNGGAFKLYNDIPSLVGYISLALFIYKFAIPCINKLFSYTNRISYEWYLVHMLVYAILKYVLNGCLPVCFEVFACLLVSYGIAYLYNIFLKKSKIG